MTSLEAPRAGAVDHRRTADLELALMIWENEGGLSPEAGGLFDTGFGGARTGHAPTGRR